MLRETSRISWRVEVLLVCHADMQSNRWQHWYLKDKFYDELVTLIRRSKVHNIVVLANDFGAQARNLGALKDF